MLTMSATTVLHAFITSFRRAIARLALQTGSVFVYVYKGDIFGLVGPDSFLYLPILGIFVFTGFPLSAYLFYQAITKANKLSEEMDKMDNM